MGVATGQVAGHPGAGRRGIAATVAVWLLLLLAAPAVGQTRTLSDIAEAIGAGAFYEQGFTGAGVAIGSAEAGHPFDGHAALAGRVTHKLRFPGLDPLNTIHPFDDHRHATMVSGVMVGGSLLADGSPSPTGPGIAHGAELWSGRIATGLGGGGDFSLSGNSVLWPLMVMGDVGVNAAGEVGGAAARTIDVLNAGWAFDDDTGNTAVHVIYDHLAYHRGVMAVAAAGNMGAGAATVAGPANAWNTIAVGATTGAGEAERVADFSSGGPAGSFGLGPTRTKPDIVAPGRSILMPTLTADPEQAGAFTTASGTSFAAAVVSGSAALLIEAGRETDRSTDPRLIKSVLLNSATKLDGWSQRTHDRPGAGTGTVVNATPLDSRQGAGRVNLEEAFKLYMASEGDGTGPGAVGAAGWDVGAAREDEPIRYFIDAPLRGGSTLTATLSWFMDRSVEGFDHAADDPFAAAAFVSNRFADLDLFLYRADELGEPVGDAVAASISGWDPDGARGSQGEAVAGMGLDSVEHLHVDLPGTGRYLLQVAWTRSPLDLLDPGINPGMDPAMDPAMSPGAGPGTRGEVFALAWSATASVPAPGSGGLLVLGVLLLALRRPRRRPRRRPDAADCAQVSRWKCR